MSREIKFRAWGKNSKEYLGDSSQGFNMEELSRLSGQFANWELEQSTGLKDKNGDKEIYEGDIVRYDAIDYVYFWDDELAGFGIKRLDGKNWFGYASFEQVREGRIVGNIHEGINEKEKE